MANPQSTHAAAQVWCDDRAKGKEFDPVLSTVFAETLDREVTLWKEGCERNADTYRDAVRKQDEQRLEIIGLKEQVAKLEADLSFAVSQKRNLEGAESVEISALRARHDAAQKELAGYREALQRERKPEWGRELRELARYLEAIGPESVVYEGEIKMFQEAARHLRLLASDYTPKANFVPMRMALEKANGLIKRLSKALEAWGPSPVDRFLVDEAKHALAAIDAVLKGGEA